LRNSGYRGQIGVQGVQALKRRGNGWVLVCVVSKKMMENGPDILNHNLETVPRLYPEVRPQAVYSRSIELLKRARGIAPGTITKSGLIVGLGEEKE